MTAMVLKKIYGSEKKYFSVLLYFLAFFIISAPAWSEEKKSLLSLGVSLPLTGQDSTQAVKWLHGMEAAISVVNHEGGIHQKQLRIITIDDGGDAVVRHNNLIQLTENEDIFGLIAAFGYNGTKDTLRIAEKNSTLFFGSNTSMKSSGPHVKSNIFTLRPDADLEMDLLVSRFIQDTGKRRISVVYIENEKGIEYINGVRKALEKRQQELLLAVPVSMENPKITSAIDNILVSSPDAIIIAADLNITNDFIKEIRQNRSDINLIAVGHTDPLELSEKLMNTGLGVVISQAVPFPFYRRIPIVNAYAAAVEAFKDQDSSIEMTFPGFEAYLNLQAFIYILKQSPSLDKASFIYTAQQQFETDLGGFRFSFSKNSHTGSNQIFLTQIAPGGFVTPIRNFSEVYEYHP